MEMPFLFQQDSAHSATLYIMICWMRYYGGWWGSWLTWPETHRESRVCCQEEDEKPTQKYKRAAVIKATWASVTPQQDRKLIASMLRCTDAVICGKATPARYWVYKWTLFRSWRFLYCKCFFKSWKYYNIKVELHYEKLSQNILIFWRSTGTVCICVDLGWPTQELGLKLTFWMFYTRLRITEIHISRLNHYLLWCNIWMTRKYWQGSPWKQHRNTSAPYFSSHHC